MVPFSITITLKEKKWTFGKVNFIAKMENGIYRKFYSLDIYSSYRRTPVKIQMDFIWKADVHLHGLSFLTKNQRILGAITEIKTVTFYIDQWDAPTIEPDTAYKVSDGKVQVTYIYNL